MQATQALLIHQLTFLIGAYCICKNMLAVHIHVVTLDWAFFIPRHKLLAV